MPANGGRTRIGGPALLPPGETWPLQRWPLAEVKRWPDYARNEVDQARTRGHVRDEGTDLVMPLSFLFQVDLVELRDERLPSEGLLLFFASVATDAPDSRFAKRVASAVRYVAGDLREAAQPPTSDPFPQEALLLRPERRVAFNLPWEDAEQAQSKLAGKARERFKAMCDPKDALFPAPADECAGLMPPSGHIALLRLIDHTELGFSVGDASWVTFTISEQDLAARKFDGACASVYVG